jgi:hypothetical protein
MAITLRGAKADEFERWGYLRAGRVPRREREREQRTIRELERSHAGEKHESGKSLVEISINY